MKPTLLLIVASLSACGSTVPDKDKNSDFNSSANNQTTANNVTPNNVAPNNVTPNNVTPNNVNPNNVTPNNVNPNNVTPNNVNPNNVNPNNVNPNNTNPNNTTCVWDQTFFGQIGGLDDHGGGVPTPAALSNDAGLFDVLLGVPDTPDDFSTIDVNEGLAEFAPPLVVSGAIVVATGPQAAGNRRFWIADSSGSLQVFLPLELSTTIRVGQSINLEVLAVQNFEGHPQIAEIGNFFVDSENNAVPYRDVNSRALTPDDYGHVVRLAGVLGSPYDCGGTSCYDFTYPGGQATLRSRSTIVMAGSCVNFAGPLYSFPGPIQSNATPTLQMDTINFDWMWVQ